MMERSGHILAGFGGAAAVGAAFWSRSPLLAAVAAAFVVPGSTAPDWLEVPRRGLGPIIKHRTITHWPVIYFAVIACAWFGDLPPLASFALTGFCVGALIHLSGDILTPSGIPLLWPTLKVSLSRLWGRNAAEARWVGLYAALGLAACYLRSRT